MKKLSYVFTGIIVSSLFATGCGNKSSVIQQPPYPNYQQGMNQGYGAPAYNAPNYGTPNYASPNTQYPQTNNNYYQSPQGTQSGGIPDSPDMSNPNSTNVIDDGPAILKPQQISPSNQTIVQQPQPSYDDSSSSEEEETSSEPWYKKVISKVKGIFSKKTG